MASTDLTRARRRWWIAALAVLLAGAGLFAALPWVLGWTVARRLLAARANAILAPSSVEFAAIRLSWFQPTEIIDLVLREGLCIAIEPMLNLGSPDVRTLDDGWTVVTEDGSLSAHWEDSVAITKDGPVVLTRV